jgi:mono/diheme cytochrome c family protein
MADHLETTMRNSSKKSALLSAIAAAASLGLSIAAQADDSANVKRGAYLVNVGGCGDCHTPMKMGSHGPEPDMTRMLSGHPAQLKMPPAPALPEGPWQWVGAATNTAFAGPWGVSYAANLTPDTETGLGKWTESQFVSALKTGKHLGASRPILPPMPWPSISRMTDSDIKAMFAYLRSVPAIVNRTPDPTPPSAVAAVNSSSVPARKPAT